jgi:hypothetical protein
MSADPLPPRGIAAPVTVLSRQCFLYVFEGTRVCPHCGGDAREIGERYRNGDYLAIEAMQRIDRLRVISPALEHDPEKCAAVFRKDHAQSKT